MKRIKRMLALTALMFAGNAALADGEWHDAVQGPVVSVRRNFIPDVAQCERKLSRGICFVKFDIPSARQEVLSATARLRCVYQDVGREVYVNFDMYKDGYLLMATSLSGSYTVEELNEYTLSCLRSKASDELWVEVYTRQ